MPTSKKSPSSLAHFKVCNCHCHTFWINSRTINSNTPYLQQQNATRKINVIKKTSSPEQESAQKNKSVLNLSMSTVLSSRFKTNISALRNIPSGWKSVDEESHAALHLHMTSMKQVKSTIHVHNPSIRSWSLPSAKPVWATLLSYRWDFIGISQNALKKGKCKVTNSSTCKNPLSFPHDTMKALSTDTAIYILPASKEK